MLRLKPLLLLTFLALLLPPGVETAYSKEIWLKALTNAGTVYLSAGAITVHAEVSVRVGNDDLGMPNSLTRGALETSFTGSDTGSIASLGWGTGPLESVLDGGPILLSGAFALGQTDVWAYTFVFSNPKDQYVTIATKGGWAYSNGPFFSPHGNFEFTFKIAFGNSTIIGGDTPGGSGGLPGSPGSGPVPTSIHAVIISGRSDPARIVTSPNVTLTGGVVALGRDPAPPTAPNPWSAGLRIVPDEALLTGAKIPPLTPNILDVRIVKHAVVGDLAVPSASP